MNGQIGQSKTLMRGKVIILYTQKADRQDRLTEGLLVRGSARRGHVQRRPPRALS